MLKKVWFMLVLCSVLMVLGCSGGMPKDNMDSVAVSGDVVSDLIMAEAEQVDLLAGGGDCTFYPTHI